MGLPQDLTFPGFVDVHVHFRDPGTGEAETVASGLEAARRGGFAAVVTMPNTAPACDSPETIRYQRDRAAAAGAGRPRLLVSACITKGRQGTAVADVERLAEAGAVFFTDDGAYVADTKVMESAMKRITALDMVVCQHAMDPSLLRGGVIRDCALARRLDLPVVAPEVEVAAIERDLSLCRVTGCRLHVQHISTARGVELVREAQREGLPVSAEATPHHLLFACDDLTDDDANFKMAPPLGNREDRAELRRAVRDGVLMFATDHAPHPAATKSAGFRTSANGILGLETAIGATYAVMVEEEKMSVDAWARAWWEMPRRILRLGEPISAETTVRVGEPWRVDVSSFASLSRNSPYDGLVFNCRAKVS